MKLKKDTKKKKEGKKSKRDKISKILRTITTLVTIVKAPQWWWLPVSQWSNHCIKRKEVQHKGKEKGERA